LNPASPKKSSIQTCAAVVTAKGSIATRNGEIPKPVEKSDTMLWGSPFPHAPQNNFLKVYLRARTCADFFMD